MSPHDKLTNGTCTNKNCNKSKICSLNVEYISYNFVYSSFVFMSPHHICTNGTCTNKKKFLPLNIKAILASFPSS